MWLNAGGESPCGDEERRGLGGNAFASTGESESFGGGGFDGNCSKGDEEVSGEVGAHGVNMRGHFRLLGDYGDVDIADGVTGIGDETDYVAEEDSAVGAGIGRVGVREVPADVTEGGGAEEGVAEGVDGDVGVAVAQKSAAVRDINTADDARTPFNEAVNVETVAYTGNEHS